MSTSRSSLRYWLALTACVAGLTLTSCNSGESVAGGASETGNIGMGLLRIETFGQASPGEASLNGFDHLYVKVESVEVHHDSLGWLTVNSTPHRVDYLMLLDGSTAVLGDTAMPTGHYNQIRLLVDRENEVVVAGKSYPLVVPNRLENCIEVSVAFTVQENDSTKVYLDFNVSRSVRKEDREWELTPVFTGCSTGCSATVCDGNLRGTIRDEEGTAVQGASVAARDGPTAFETVSDYSGRYSLSVPVGTYTVSCCHSMCDDDGCYVTAAMRGDVHVVEGEATIVDFLVGGQQHGTQTGTSATRAVQAGS